MWNFTGRISEKQWNTGLNFHAHTVYMVKSYIITLFITLEGMICMNMTHGSQQNLNLVLVHFWSINLYM